MQNHARTPVAFTPVKSEALIRLLVTSSPARSQILELHLQLVEEVEEQFANNAEV